MVDRDTRGGSALLMVPTEKRSGVSPIRYRSRSKSKRSRSGSPLPFLMKEDREKSPFEIGDTKAMLKAAPKAVFDKALVMDISPSVAKKGDEEIIYITTDMSVIDKALVMDISSATYIVLEDEDDEDEIDEISEDVALEEEKPDEAEELEAEGEVAEKKVKKVVKKKKKKVAGKKEKTPPIKLEIKGEPKKINKGMFDKKEEAAPAKKEKKPISAAKLEKLKQIEEMKAAAAAAKAAEEAEKAKKEEEKKRRAAESLAKRKGPEVPESGLQAVLDKQKKRLDDKNRGINDPLDSKKGRTEQEIIDYKSGLRKVSNAGSNDSNDSNATVEFDSDGNEIQLRPIKQNGYHDDDDSDNEDRSDRSDRSDQSDREDKSGGESDEEHDNENHEGDMDTLRDFENKRMSMGNINPTDATTAELQKIFFVQKPKEDKTPWKAIEEEPQQENVVKREPVKTEDEKEKDREFKRQREAARPPTLDTFLTDRTVREHETLKITCAAQGPDLNIRWTKDGNIIEKTPRIKIMSREGLQAIEIPKASISDSGEYLCLIRNKNGEVSTKCTVKVYKEVFDAPAAPTFTTIRGKIFLSFLC